MSSSWFSEIGSLILGFAALFGIVYLVTLIRALRALRWTRPQLRRLTESECPLYLRERAGVESVRLAELGFVSDGPISQGTYTHGQDDLRWLWRHEEAGTIVLLNSIVSPKRLNGAEWVLATALGDGSWVITTSEDRDLPLPWLPEEQVEMALELSFTPLWTLHLQRVQQRCEAQNAMPRALDEATAESAWGAHLLRRWEFWAANQELFAPQPDGSLRTTWSWLLRKGVFSAMATQRRLEKVAKSQTLVAADQPPPLSPEAAVEADVTNVRHQDLMKQARRLTPRGRLAVSAISAALFIGLMAWRDNLAFALILTGVVLLHELGHVAAMRLFGSRDTSLLFIPLVGGAALRNDRPLLQPWQDVIIILAGPLPGIVLGFLLVGLQSGLAPSSVPSWFNEAIGSLLVINILNLVPIMPLDGGQLVNHAFLHRFPYFGAVFKGSSGVGLLLLGSLLGNKFLWLPAFGLLFRIPLDWRLAGVLRDLRRSAKEDKFWSAEEEPWLRRIFRRFQQEKFDGTNAQFKAPEAIRLAEILRQPMPGFGTILLALIGWFSPIWLPIVGIPFFVIQAEKGDQARRWEFLTEPLPAIWMSPEKAQAAAKAIPPAENAAIEYAEAAKLTQAARGKSDQVPAEAWRLMVAGAKKRSFPSGPAAVEEGDDPPPSASEIVSTRLGDTFRGDDAAAILEAANVAARLAEQLATSPDARGGVALCEHVMEWLATLEGGLRRQRQVPLPAETLASLARTLPSPDLLTQRVAPAFVFQAREAAERPAPLAEAGMLGRIFQWSLRHADGDRVATQLAQASEVRNAVAKGRFDPWKFSVRSVAPEQEAKTGDPWKVHQAQWAAAVVRIDMARAALAWHARSAATGRPPKSVGELRVAWFAEPSPHPVNGRTWQLVERRNGSDVRLEIPNPKPAAPVTDLSDRKAMREMLTDMLSPKWSLVRPLPAAGKDDDDEEADSPEAAKPSKPAK